MPETSVRYTPRPDSTPEGELRALANVYRFILDCHAKKMAAEPHQSKVVAEGADRALK